ncbi:RING finger and transmembrane domain-containing protein 2 isoform X2 [Venturia canescens]|nr:RING finger and transmembrane domain-containing protein 2-like isoform X2 [Venturia canescens]
MVHTACTIEALPTATHRSYPNCVTRTMDQNRMFSERMPATLQGTGNPVAQTCTHQPEVSLTSWINRRLQERRASGPRTSLTESYVINVDDDLSPETTDVSDREPAEDHHDFHSTTVADNHLNDIREATTGDRTSDNNHNDNNEANNNNRRNSEAEALMTLPLTSESRDLLYLLLDVLNKCLPFAIILLSKCIYDYKACIIEFLGLLIIFTTANRDLKREIAKQQNGSWKILLSILAYIRGCFFLIDYIFEEPLFRMYTVPKTMSELLWSVIITDMVLKLFTITFKVFVTCLPARILPYARRGKYYLVMEACSQFYRSTATVYPWFFYLWDCYGGSETFIAHLFAVIYTNNKFSDVVARGKLLWGSLKKMWQNVSLGVSPSKDQLVAAGSVCVICHEEFSNPVLLQCKHIFCEACVTTWLDRERTCPLCRAPISDDPVYRDGHTTDFIQWY